MITVTFDETKWQVVPKDATKKMMEAASECCYIHEENATRQQVWEAMLAAAPKPQGE